MEGGEKWEVVGKVGGEIKVGVGEEQGGQLGVEFKARLRNGGW